MTEFRLNIQMSPLIVVNLGVVTSPSNRGTGTLLVREGMTVSTDFAGMVQYGLPLHVLARRCDGGRMYRE